MALIRVPAIIKLANPGLTWSMPANRKVLYFTFDDGPTPWVTEEILSILQQYQAIATFFCIGRNVERHPEIYNRIIEAGHATGNHTYSHLKGWFTANREYYGDIRLASQFVDSGLFRPAYGLITPGQVMHLKKEFRIVMWDVMSYDFDPGTTREKCLQNVTGYAKPGSVVVFHDSVKASEKVLYALPGVLDHFSRQGFTFESIPPNRTAFKSTSSEPA